MKHEAAFHEQGAEAARLHRAWNNMTSEERREFTVAIFEWAGRRAGLEGLPHTDGFDAHDQLFLSFTVGVCISL